LVTKNCIKRDLKNSLTIVETKRIENITSLLKKHEKITSSKLSQLTGLSRTRCNEYFKLMENLGIVKVSIEKKEKFYKLKL
jgi:DNA-binding transcriptional regulator LsrR (DeoR family)